MIRPASNTPSIRPRVAANVNPREMGVKVDIA
jgi:hypothetical protein